MDAHIRRGSGPNLHTSPACASGPRPRAPLAERVRPKTLEGVLGQDDVVAPASILHKLVALDRIPSCILWGPPGCGKTTIARALATKTKSHFVQLSAVTTGLARVKEVVEEARKRKVYGNGTLLFVDEIHRFNKAQQDAFLPHVESGLLTLVGATTENPSFEVGSQIESHTDKRQRCIVTWQN